MSFGFYPRHNDACPNVGHCPHAGGAAIATLVQLSNDNEQFHRYLHGTISYRSSVPTSEGAPTDRSAASRAGVDMKLLNQVEVKQGDNVVDLVVP